MFGIGIGIGTLVLVAVCKLLLLFSPKLDRSEMAKEAARLKHNIDTKYMNFGFAGHSKTGKSSLINSLRGLKNNAEFAAGVDTIEKTHKVQMYPFTEAEFKMIRLYDIPGCGTVTHKTDGYYIDNGLAAFDVLVILVQDTIGTDEIELAKFSKDHKQPVMFVRSKMDISFRNAVENDGIYDKLSQENANKLIHKTKNHIKHQLKSQNITGDDIFCVSSVILQKLRNNTKFDFHFEEDEFFKALFMKIEISRNVVVNPLTLHNYQKEIEKLRKHVMKKFSGDKSSENSSENDDSEVPPLNDEVPEIPPLNYEDAPEVPPLNGNEEYAVKMLEFEVEEKEKLDEIPAHFSKAEEFFQNNSGNSFKSFKIVTLLFIVFAFLFVI